VYFPKKVSPKTLEYYKQINLEWLETCFQSYNINETLQIPITDSYNAQTEASSLRLMC